MSAAIDHEFLHARKYIFNHDIMHCTAEGVVGNELYSSRALAITEPWDTIQLHPGLRSQWYGICSHYQRIGLSHTEQVIWDLDLKHLGGHIGFQPSVFFYGPHEYKNWGDNKWLVTVNYINSKNNFIALSKALDVYTPSTQCFNNVDEIDLNTVRNAEYPCYLKAAISVAGVGIYRCENEAELLQAMRCYEKNVPVQIQEEIKAEKFLNLQYQVINNQVFRLAASEQVLDGFSHQGNRFPASHEPWEQVDKMAYWLSEHGIKGIFAFDVAVLQTEQGLRFPVIECNPRFNGASYPTLVAQKLDIPEWSALTVSTKHRNLKDLCIHDLEFNMQTGEGVVIVNWGTIQYGKLMLLLAGSQEYQEVLLNELKTRL